MDGKDRKYSQRNLQLLQNLFKSDEPCFPDDVKGLVQPFVLHIENDARSTVFSMGSCKTQALMDFPPCLSRGTGTP